MTATTRVGMNLAANTYYATEFPFIDRMKSAGDWVVNGATEPLQLTADGYPVRMPAGASSAYTMIGLDPTPADYVLLYEGPGAPYMQGAAFGAQAPGRVAFHHDGGQMLLAIGGAGYSNMRICRADHEALLAAGKLFNPAFTDKIAAFDTLRYMDWGYTNGSKVANWSDRTTLSARTWQGSGNSSVPIEVMVALANETRTNMWLDVPTFATDDYVRQMMGYVHDHLDVSLSVHLEYSNEVWNWQFQQSGYAAGQGDALWDHDANGDGRIDRSDPAEHSSADWMLWYGYRAAQIAHIANQAFGSDDSRLHNVLATQTVWVGLQDWTVEGIARAKVGSVSDLFDDYAVTTYFDGMLRGANDADRATILSWARGGDAGLTAAFAALTDGTGLTAEDAGSLKWLGNLMATQGAVAKAHGLNLVAYEGGVDLTGGESQGGEVVAFLKRLQADPRMGEIYGQMVAGFAAAGGTLLNVLIDVDAGFWGTLKSIYDEGTPEWDALVAAQKAATATAAPSALPVPAPAPAPDPAPSAAPVSDPIPKLAEGELYEALIAVDRAKAHVRALVKAYRK